MRKTLLQRLSPSETLQNPHHFPLAFPHAFEFVVKANKVAARVAVAGFCCNFNTLAGMLQLTDVCRAS